MKRILALGWTVGEFPLSAEVRIWLRAGIKPLAVGVALLLVLWLGMWLMPQTAHAETRALACPVGQEESGGLCYPPCQEGYVGLASTCWAKCKAGQIDDGAFCRTEGHIVAKYSYGRGAGVGMVCGTNQEGQGGLCYSRCAPGYYGVGPVCWQACRAGYADHGATCFRHIFDFYGKATYGRGAGGPVSACSAGAERSGALCYPRCSAGFYGIGPTCWQRCPAGYKDDGAICRKDVISVAKASYGRGAGQVMNSVPEAVDETVRTPKDTPVNPVFEYNDLNDEIDSVVHVQRPQHGNLDGNTYTPNPGYEGPDTILWKLTDGKNESNVAIVTILVGNVGVNSAPVAVDRTVEVSEDTPTTITVTCTDAENDDLFYQLVAKPQHGTYQWQPPNQVIYTPDPDFTGTDFFTFRSHDGQDASNVSTITLNVGAVDDAPLAQAQAISMTRNSNVGITLVATDAEGDVISYRVVTSPTHGLLSGTAPELLYAPAQDFVGQDSLVFAADDGQGASTEATIAITVLPANSPPVASTLALTTTEDIPVTVDLSASDAEGDAITFTLVTSPTHGLLEGEGAAWVYTPEAGFVGTDGFTYQASDGQSATVATVSIQVAAGPAQANVVGIVYDDVNGNGQPDEGEIGADGLLVTLVPANAQQAGVVATLTGSYEVRTDGTGAWRFEAVPLGAYTLRITGASGVSIATLVEVALNVDQRGTVQAPLAAVVVTGRALFLPRVMAGP